MDKFQPPFAAASPVSRTQEDTGCDRNQPANELAWNLLRAAAGSLEGVANNQGNNTGNGCRNTCSNAEQQPQPQLQLAPPLSVPLSSQYQSQQQQRPQQQQQQQQQQRQHQHQHPPLPALQLQQQIQQAASLPQHLLLLRQQQQSAIPTWSQSNLTNFLAIALVLQKLEQTQKELNQQTVQYIQAAATLFNIQNNLGSNQTNKNTNANTNANTNNTSGLTSRKRDRRAFEQDQQAAIALGQQGQQQQRETTHPNNTSASYLINLILAVYQNNPNALLSAIVEGLIFTAEKQKEQQQTMELLQSQIIASLQATPPIPTLASQSTQLHNQLQQQGQQPTLHNGNYTLAEALLQQQLMPHQQQPEKQYPASELSTNKKGDQSSASVEVAASKEPGIPKFITIPRYTWKAKRPRKESMTDASGRCSNNSDPMPNENHRHQRQQQRVHVVPRTSEEIALAIVGGTANVSANARNICSNSGNANGDMLPPLLPKAGMEIKMSSSSDLSDQQSIMTSDASSFTMASDRMGKKKY